MRVVIAPDSFKGTLDARSAAEAIADGWRSVRAGDELRLLPMADGGEGTLEALAAPGARRIPVRVPGPDDRVVEAVVLLLPDGTGVVELASTSGITLIDPLRPMRAHTRGFGVAIRAALDAGATALLLTIGGSASTDGGTGALRELGARFLDAAGAEVPDGGAGLLLLERVDLTRLRAAPAGGVRVVTDVTSPLLGPGGAAAVFAPQKGASPAEAADLERGLARLAARLPAAPDASGAGAAGGTGFGLLAWGAELVPGAAAVAAAAGLPLALRGADLVVTGEGRFDAQSARGKVPEAVRALADGVPTALVAGAVDAEPAGYDSVVSLTDLVGRDASFADPAAALRRAGALLAAR
ncbi:glycerate kinase [Amnibacterium kyonggiense]